MQTTKIEWADATWNPVTGKGVIVCHPDRLDQPCHWSKPRRILVGSMTDPFHEDVPDSFRDQVYAAMALCPQHTFLLLTKRPGTALKWYAYDSACRVRADRVSEACIDSFGLDGDAEDPTEVWPLANVGLGVRVVDQKAADERIPLLLQTPASVLFVLFDPMLGPVDLGYTFSHGYRDAGGSAALGWVICGGETGPGARPMNPTWPRSLRDQCQAAGVPFFFKGWGDWAPKAHFANFAEWDRAAAHTLVLPDGRHTVNRGRDVADEEIGLTCYDLDGNEGCAAMARIGKKSAGRLLDGREHNEFPKVAKRAAP